MTSKVKKKIKNVKTYNMYKIINLRPMDILIMISNFIKKNNNTDNWEIKIIKEFNKTKLHTLTSYD